MLLNLDCGELTDEPDDLLRLADLLNVACGGHAGDADSMRRVVVLAMTCAPPPGIGAHPSYVDREHFGRRSIAVPAAVLERDVRDQSAKLLEIARGEGALVTHVKLHGALYHDANRDPVLAKAVLDGAVSTLGTVTVIGAAGGEMEGAAKRRGLPFLREGFADRRQDAAGALLPRTDPRATIDDPDEARRMVRALRDRVDTICVHGDTPRAIEIARAVREELWAIGSR